MDRNILEEIAAERDRQDEKWGGPAHDDQHDPRVFCQLIEDYAGWARVMSELPHQCFSMSTQEYMASELGRRQASEAIEDMKAKSNLACEVNSLLGQATTDKN